METIDRDYEYLSIGLCPGCEVCADDLGVNLEELEKGIRDGTFPDESCFSFNSCGWCNHNLGGDRYAAHGIYKTGELKGQIEHFEVCADCCTDWAGC